MRLVVMFSGVLVVVNASSCVGSLGRSGDEGGGGGGGGNQDDGEPGAAPTYYRDVLPILQTRCTHCHAGGGAAFPLDSYPDASASAALIAAVTADRKMPPWPPDPTCGSFVGEDRRALTQAQIDTLDRWQEAGAPEGDLADAPPPPPPLATLGEPDMVLDAGGDFVLDGTREDLYWCIRLPADFTGGMDVVGMQIEPGNRGLVHHVITFIEPGGATQPKGLPGFECGGVPPRTDFFFGWAPGAEPAVFPEGMGMHIEANDALVMQVHYHRNPSAGQNDRTKLALYRAPGPLATRLRVVWTGTIDINVTAGSETTTTGECVIPATAAPLTLVAVAPHMHQVATAFHSSVKRGSDEICLIDIPRWDFEWQGGYRYQQPLVLQPGDVIQTSCTYRNSTSGTVAFGEATSDEMCFQFNFVADDGTLPEKCFAPCTYLPCDDLGI